LNIVNTIKTDVIVVGGGLAGLYAAWHASQDAHVVLLSKGTFSVSNSMWAQGGIAAAMADDDSPAFHLQDTLKAGRDLCSERAVELLVHEGPRCIEHLIELGVPFDREEGQLALGLEGGHGKRRVLHANGLATGAAVTSALTHIVLARSAFRKALRDNNTTPSGENKIQPYEHMVVVELLRDDARCVGVLAYHEPTCTWWRFLAPATILATGGAAGLYARTTNPAITRGDGVALAYRAGAAVADLEFIQFHPTGLVPPKGNTFLLSEAIRGEGAHLRNIHGERFMLRYDERAELAPRDVVARAILNELRSTGASHVWLDLSPIKPAVILHHFKVLYERCLAIGLDMLHDPMPVAPAAHYVMGGVCTDLHGATNVPGLFACGEVACTGVQGANRLASNSLLECLVFGRRSAQSALNWAAMTPASDCHDAPTTSTDEILLPVDSFFTAQVGQLLWHHAGLIRNQAGLSTLLQQLVYIESRTDHDMAQNTLLVAKLITQGALLRTESRGGHYRTDYPTENPTWRQRIIFQQAKEPVLDDLNLTDFVSKNTGLKPSSKQTKPFGLGHPFAAGQG